MSERRRPLYSTKEDEPDLEEEISDFVVRLAELVDTLQDAQSAGDLQGLDRLAEALAEQAEALGYGLLGEEARQLCAACKQEKQDEIQEALVELTEISRRIRLGHRGAA